MQWARLTHNTRRVSFVGSRDESHPREKERGREEGEGNSKYVTAARRGGTQVTYSAERRAGRGLKTNNVSRPRSAAAVTLLNHV